MVEHLFFSRKWQCISAILEDMALEVGGADLRREIQIVIKDTEKKFTYIDRDPGNVDSVLRLQSRTIRQG